MTIALVNGVLVADVSAINGVADIAAVDGQPWPAGGGASPILWSTTDKTAGFSLAEGNARATNASGGLQSIRSDTFFTGSAKRVFALELITCGGSSYSGLNDPTEPIGTINERYWLKSKGGSHFLHDVSQWSGSSAGMSNGDLHVFAVDEAARKVWYAINSVTWVNSGNPAAGTGEALTMGGAWEFRILIQDLEGTFDCRILSGGTFPYSIPSGFS